MVGVQPEEYADDGGSVHGVEGGSCRSHRCGTGTGRENGVRQGCEGCSRGDAFRMGEKAKIARE